MPTPRSEFVTQRSNYHFGSSFRYTSRSMAAHSWFFRSVQVNETNKRVAINPFISSGRPALRGSGIMTEVVWNRAKAGESMPVLARDFRLKPSDVKAAIHYCEAAAA